MRYEPDVWPSTRPLLEPPTPILFIPVKDEKPGSQLAGEGLPQLLHDPKSGGRSRGVEVQDPAAIVANNEEAEEHAEGNGRDREEVHGRNRFPIIAQKGEPTLGGLSHPTPYGGPYRN